jgi:glutamate dehydrogenase
MVNRMGATFTLRMTEDTGRTPGEVAKAYTISREALDVRGIWAAIDALDGKVPEDVQVDALQAIWHLLRGTSRWLLSRPGPLPAIAPAVERYRSALDEIRANLPGVLPEHRGGGHSTRLAHWQQRGVPAALAAQLAALPLLDAGFDIVELARQRKLPPTTVARAFYALGDALHLPWLLEQIDALPVEGRWHAHARGVLRDELRSQQRVLVGQLLAATGKRTPEQRLAEWLQRDDAQLRFTQQMFSELMAQRALDYPTASVAVRRLAQMAEAEG